MAVKFSDNGCQDDFTPVKGAEGVYLLFDHERLSYVGQSGNVHKRVRQHKSNGKRFDKFFMIEAIGPERDTVEQELIRRLTPPENKTYKVGSAVNLDADLAEERKLVSALRTTLEMMHKDIEKLRTENEWLKSGRIKQSEPTVSENKCSEVEAMPDVRPLLRRGEAAKYLKQHYGAGTAGTLAKLATIGGGPEFSKLGRFPVYRIQDLDEWANSKLSARVSSTSEIRSQSLFRSMSNH